MAAIGCRRRSIAAMAAPTATRVLHQCSRTTFVACAGPLK